MAESADHSVDVVALNADVVNYSRLLADNFESTTAAMDVLHGIVVERVNAGGGTLANFVGDNFMAIFDDPKDALQAAIAITTAVEEVNRDVVDTRMIRFRMGLDQGSAAIIDGDYLGDALNIAARIQALAPVGGINVTADVYRALDEPALRFRPRGRRRLKNIPEMVEIYEFADLPTDRATSRPGTALGLETPTLAVIPIHTEMIDDQARAAAAFIRGDLVHRLSTIPELRLIDASDTAGHPVEHSARYMLETGVNQAGQSVRVYATLFDVTTMNVVKSHRWRSTVVEMLDLTDEICDEVAATVAIELVVGAPAGLYSELDDPKAIENVYLGWYHLRSDNREGWAKAVELFDDVARTHPDQPYGHSLSAFANWIGASNEWVSDVQGAYRLARDQARRSIDMDDPTGMGMAVDAAILMSMGEFDKAAEVLDDVEIIRPTCDVTYGLQGSLHRYMGDWQRAVDLLDVAIRLTGITKPWYPTVKACCLFIGERLEQSLALAEGVLEFQPHNLEALLIQAAAQVELGMERRARATAQLIRDQFASVDIADWIDRSPYQDREMVDRWKADLTAAGLIAAD